MAQHSVFACDMSAIAPEERPAHLQVIRDLFGSVRGIRELPDGYAFELPTDASTLHRAADFIRLERMCCPFFGFRLDQGPEQGGLWLHLTGPEGVKPFIMAEIGGALPATHLAAMADRRAPRS